MSKLQSLEIIIPKYNNQGASHQSCIDFAVKRLCEDFGGVTVLSDGKGYWRSPDRHIFYQEEEVQRIRCAAPQTNIAKQKIRNLSKQLLGMMPDQEALYVQYPNQTVEILTRSQLPKAPAAASGVLDNFDRAENKTSLLATVAYCSLMLAAIVDERNIPSTLILGAVFTGVLVMQAQQQRQVNGR